MVTTAANLLQNAKSYAAAAEILAGLAASDEKYASAFYLLLCFALELSFKATCLDCGASDEEIRKLGHDLHSAYLLAMQKGRLPPYMTPLGQLVLLLNDYHRTHIFRYTPDIPEIIVPPPGWCMGIVREHIESIKLEPK